MIFDTIDNLEMYIPILPKLRKIIDIMDHDDVYAQEAGKHETKDEDLFYFVNCYETSSADSDFEFHKKYTDVQIMLSGKELQSTTWRELAGQASFDKEEDEGFFKADPTAVLKVAQGRFTIYFPGEPHRTGIADGEAEAVKKVVFKVAD